MGSHRLLEHTADMGIEATAGTPEELFAEAALGLLEMIFGESEADFREERTVEVHGGDLGELLVNWLNEVLYLFEMQQFCPAGFEVELRGETRLKARVSGEPFDPRRHPVEREVKAVTYHLLEVGRSGDQWRAVVYVDL